MSRKNFATKKNVPSSTTFVLQSKKFINFYGSFLFFLFFLSFRMYVKIFHFGPQTFMFCAVSHALNPDIGRNFLMAFQLKKKHTIFFTLDKGRRRIKFKIHTLPYGSDKESGLEVSLIICMHTLSRPQMPFTPLPRRAAVKKKKKNNQPESKQQQK